MLCASKVDFFFLPLSLHFVTIPNCGAIKSTLTLLVGRPDWTSRRLNCQPTGAHTSPRSVSVWGSASRCTSLWSTSMPTPCTRWSPTENIVPLHWVVSYGRHSWDPKPHCSSIVTWKGLMCHQVQMLKEQELASLEITKKIATRVIQESVLERMVTLIPLTFVEMWPHTEEIMEIGV